MGGGGGDWGLSQATLGPSLKSNRNSRFWFSWPRWGDSRPLGQCKPGPAVKPVCWGCRGCPKHGVAPLVGTGHSLTHLPAPHPRRAAAVHGDSLHTANTSGVKWRFRRRRQEALPCSPGPSPGAICPGRCSSRATPL